VAGEADAYEADLINAIVTQDDADGYCTVSGSILEDAG